MEKSTVETIGNIGTDYFRLHIYSLYSSSIVFDHLHQVEMSFKLNKRTDYIENIDTCNISLTKIAYTQLEGSSSDIIP